MKTLYLICCSMRTGSTLLEHVLFDAGAGRPREYLHGNQPGMETYAKYARRIYNGNKRRDLMGWRVMWGQLWDQQRKLPHVWGNVPVETMLDGVIGAVDADEVHYIHLTRRDRLRQAVSYIRAQEGNRWYCPEDETPPDVAIPFTKPVIDRVEYLLGEFPKYDRMWEDYFTARHIAPLRLVYEDMTATPDTIRATFWQIVDYIGAGVDGDYQVTIPLKKQAGDDVERWIAQYEQRHLSVGN